MSVLGARRPISERLFDMVKRTSTCWLFTGHLDGGGYGLIRSGGRNSKRLKAHRVAYELAKGPIPEGLHIDHLCSVRNCVNPAHLEAVTPRANTLRSMAPAAVNARLTHCKKAGHPLTPDNLSNDTPGHRRCKTCRAEYERERGVSRWPAIKERRRLAREERAA